MIARPYFGVPTNDKVVMFYQGMIMYNNYHGTRHGLCKDFQYVSLDLSPIS